MLENQKAEPGKDLTVSQIDRQNILNNPYVLTELEKISNIQGIVFEGKTVLLKEQVARFFEVSSRTVESYLAKNEQELLENGYEVLKGQAPEIIENISGCPGCSRSRFREHR